MIVPEISPPPPQKKKKNNNNNNIVLLLTVWKPRSRLVSLKGRSREAFTSERAILQCTGMRQRTLDTAHKVS